MLSGLIKERIFNKGSKKNYYSSFLVGTFDDYTNKYIPISKVGTGYTIEKLQELVAKVNGLILEDKTERELLVQDTNLKPDVFLYPKLIFEISFDSYSKSQIYELGKREFGTGVSLRFPYFVRERNDKETDGYTKYNEILEQVNNNLISNYK